MAKVKEGDFIEISFIGRIQTSNKVFDLTDEELAKKNNLYNPNFKYGPRKICIGEGHVIKGLDKQLVEKEIGRSYIIEVGINEGFGDKNPRLVKIMNLNVFKKDNIHPFPGLQITADNLIGTVRSVTGGRVVVDFNHPLSGQNLVYEITILKQVTKDLEKLDILLLNEVGLEKEKYKVNSEGNNNYEIKIGKMFLPEEVKIKFKEKAKKLIPAINIEFYSGEEKKDVRE